MRIQADGQIVKGFHVAGSAAVPVYVLEAPRPALFEAGFTALYPRYRDAVRQILGARAPAYLFLTHAHWDHIGAAACLKREWPAMQIVASPRVREILANPRALAQIRRFNAEAVATVRAWGVPDPFENPFEVFQLDRTAGDGACFALGGGLTVRVLASPGHTWDFSTYYVPEKRILLASEAAGCDDGQGYIVTEFLADYDLYRASLERLRRLDVEVLCPGHRVVLTGPEARAYLERSPVQAELFVALVNGILTEEGGDIERTVQRVKAQEWDPKPSPKQPESAYLLNTRIRVRKLRERLLRTVTHKASDS